MKSAICGLMLAFAPAVATPTVMARAPVYIYEDDAVIRRAGTFTYEQKVGFEVLYCIRESEGGKRMQCVVHVPGDRLVLINALATEQKI